MRISVRHLANLSALVQIQVFLFVHLALTNHLMHTLAYNL